MSLQVLFLSARVPKDVMKRIDNAILATTSQLARISERLFIAGI
jgi:hypothetical protein